jgi:hypothetical protein
MLIIVSIEQDLKGKPTRLNDFDKHLCWISIKFVGESFQFVDNDSQQKHHGR